MRNAEESVPHMLREYMMPNTKSEALKEPTTEEKRHLQRIADAFFADRDVVLASRPNDRRLNGLRSLFHNKINPPAPPADSPSGDRLRVMTELYYYLHASKQYNVTSFASDKTKATKDHIECLRWAYVHDGYCYDGGCYSDESYTVAHTLHIDIISPEQWDAELTELKDQRFKGRNDYWEYQGELPNDDALVFQSSWDSLYMHHPFGSVFDFRLKWEKEEY